jgi:site-specific recombinase XerD
MTATPPAQQQRFRPSSHRSSVFKQHDDPVVAQAAVTARDTLSICSVLELFPTLPNWPKTALSGHRVGHIHGARTILEWLNRHPGRGWQDRWLVSGADRDLDWIDTFIIEDCSRNPTTQRTELTAGLTSLLLCRIFLPSYDFLASYKAYKLYAYTRQVFRPELFARIEASAQQLERQPRSVRDALALISKIVLHTGRDADALTADDLLAYRTWQLRRPKPYVCATTGLSLAWAALRGVADLGEHPTIKEAVRFGQRPTTELVDAYNIGCKPIRDLLVRYLDERRPSLDYSSFTRLVGALVGTFWADIEHHHPGINSLHLPEHVVEGWKSRLRTVIGRDGTTRPRGDYIQLLMPIRGFYRDIQEWAHDDPYWVKWSAPSPVRKRDTAGARKAQRKTTAAMHQRVRERLPHLPVLVDEAERHKTEQAAFLAATKHTAIEQTLNHAGRDYRRTRPRAYQTRYYRDCVPPVQVEDLTTGEIIDVGKREHDAFWAWASIEVLRHTGVRIEELMEITHLGLVSYQLPDTGEVVPMLQIVPSKSNEERLLLVGPELASVLATIITRLRNDNGGTVPLTTRYDPYERVTGPALPHLFQHRRGWRWEVPNQTTIQKWITQVLTRLDLTDAAGQPLRYTAHDFRRIFASDAVASGLPVHIVARLLGHKNLNTSQAYIAVFDEDLVRAYRTFLDNRRSLRPQAEYREPTEQEWRKFQAHFQTRKLELGECGRPYGSTCKHEHSCLRCPSLRLAPTARPRLMEIIANLRDRISEAKLNGWFGEVEGLKVSLEAASRKLVSLDRMQDRPPSGPVNLGIPVITDPPPS